LLSFLGRRLFDAPVHDLYCGLRGFRRDAILSLGLTAPGMEFALEMIVKAALRGLSIAEVPTTLSPDGRDRAPHLRSFRDGWRSLRFYLLLCPRWLFLYPGILLAACGGMASTVLVISDVEIGNIVFAHHSLILTAANTYSGETWSGRPLRVDAGLLPVDPALNAFRRLLILERVPVGIALSCWRGRSLCADLAVRIVVWRNQGDTLTPDRLQRELYGGARLPADLRVVLHLSVDQVPEPAERKSAARPIASATAEP
jgi:hypothetical protein